MFAILLVGQNINPALYTRNMGMHKMTMHEPWGTKFAVVRTPFQSFCTRVDTAAHR